MKLQIEFVEFPGVKPWEDKGGWPHLPLPWRSASDDDDDESLANALMELIDWMIDNHSELLHISDQGGDYEAVNDYSLTLVEILHNGTDPRHSTEGKGGIWSEWYNDVEIPGFDETPTGITLRIAAFLSESR